MATYNGERYVKEQLASLAAQKLLPCELVVTDDGSTDSTIAIVEEFGRCAPFPVRLTRNVQRLGVRDNFIQAATKCTGDLVAFCDQDDVWLPSKLEIMAEKFADQNVMLVVHSASISDSKMKIGDNRYLRYPRDRRIRALHFDLLFSAWGFAMVFRRRVADIVDFLLMRYRDRPECETLFHDTLVQMVSQMLGDTFVLTDILAIYRRHGENVTTHPPRPKFRLRRNISHQTLFGYLRSKARFAAFFADCFRLLEADGPASAPAEAEYAAKFFYKAAKAFSLRAEIYDPSSSSLKRLQSFFFLVSRRAYRARRRYGFGYPSFLIDAYVIVCTVVLRQGSRPKSAAVEAAKKLQ